MEDNIKDAIITETTDDHVLSLLIEVTAHSLLTGRPLFENPLDEPVLYRRYFAPWVKEGLDEAQTANKKLKEAESRAVGPVSIRV